MSKICELCLDGGDLVICDGCDKCWHAECHPPRLTEAEIKSKGKWFCFKCRDDSPFIEHELTDEGHLLGCTGREVPNRPGDNHKPECKHHNCGLQIYRQSCLWIENGIEYGWCSKHYEENGSDRDLSKCADEIAQEIGFDLEQRAWINQFNIKALLGLDPRLKGIDTTHVSDHRRTEASNMRKARDNHSKREEIEQKTRWEVQRIQDVIDMAEAEPSSVDDSMDAEPSSVDESFDAEPSSVEKPSDSIDAEPSSVDESFDSMDVEPSSVEEPTISMDVEPSIVGESSDLPRTILIDLVSDDESHGTKRSREEDSDDFDLEETLKQHKRQHKRQRRF